MSAEPSLDYLPEELPDDSRRRLQELGVESTQEPAPLEVSEYLIRHWCEALEDGNPLYLDTEYAKSQGFRGLVAPPGTIMTTFAMPFRWPWPPSGSEPARHIHYDVKEALGLPVGIITDVDVEFGEPLQAGDRLSVSQRLVSVSAWKKTRVGEGRFWTMERLYRNQSAALVARERMTAFGYGGQDSRTAVEASEDGWSPAVEGALRGTRTGYQPERPRIVFWEDVHEGDQLPTLVMPFTLTRAAYLASATRDFSPQHSNRDYAQRVSKARDVFVNTPFNMGMISRFLTDWAGPGSTVRRIKIAMKGNVCAGDDMIITGGVAGKRTEGAEHLVDLDITISTQDGPVTPCTATLALPSRAVSSG